MPTYQLSIITPQGKIFDDQIDSLIAPGTEGSFGVLARHAPMASLLTKGILFLKKDGKEIYFAISSGVLEINQQSHVLLLSDYAIQATSPEEAKAVQADNS